MIELLAPVGSQEALIAAVESGADAVYLGGKAFGARHYAPNFTDEELADAVRFAHLRGVFVYVTVNTLVDDSEIRMLEEYLVSLYNIGVDAIIVQDIGVASIAKRVVPKLALHASTQMTVHNLDGVVFLAQQGFTRVVLAREVSLEDIRYICKHSPIEIETFIHGALCISYSGQCLMSSLIGGRSGNRGRCAQPCRLPYTLVNQDGQDVLENCDNGEYLLSPKDLNTIELIPELIEGGIVSFKIEGRMKRPEYVAVVVDTYRRAIDSYLLNQETYQVTDQTQKNLAQIFNRDFTTAYLQRKEGRQMMSDRRPNNRGVRIGRVIAYDSADKTAVIKLDEALAIGDMVEFWVKVGGRVNTSVTSITVQGKPVTQAEAGIEVTIPVHGPGIRVSDRVFKTFDARLMEQARSFFNAPAAVRRIPVDIQVEAVLGSPLVIKMLDADGYTGEAKTAFIAEPALKRPLTEETIAKQVDRLGTTVFELRSLECRIDGQLMVPVSEINEARRNAVEALEEARLVRFARTRLTMPKAVIMPTYKAVQAAQTQLTVNVDTLDKVKAAVDNGADWILFGGESFHHLPFTANDYTQAVRLCRDKHVKIILNTPRLIKEWQVAEIKRNLQLFIELRPDAIGISNLGTLHMLQQLDSTVPVHGDFSLNIYNSIAIEFFANHGVQSLTLSPELNFTQIENLAARTNTTLECLVHGHLTMMISEYCTVGSYLGQLHTGKCNQACLQGRFWLKDRLDEIFPVVTDQYCRMHVLNAKELNMAIHVPRFSRMGIKRIRIEAKQGSAQKVGEVTKLYRDLLTLGENHHLFTQYSSEKPDNSDITRGHYFRGVL
ncbi:DUF3656 domain-containing protein [Anaerospora sp.]|jgi:putative protease|uniref:DUF3656 domain-containing U32 family peptidase n=1 Tax=Anaerospora sp. TaxID=1960278 RepID=UPI00289EACEE|nr:DUF3656 domain-containing protein [Anaerospora sp.]MDF2927970.1 peptidase [Anaerospora sp.]